MAAAATRRVKVISARVCACAVQRQQSLHARCSVAHRWHFHFLSLNPEHVIMWRQRANFPAPVAQLRPLLVCAPRCLGIASFSLTLPSGCKACSSPGKAPGHRSLSLFSPHSRWRSLARSSQLPVNFSSSTVFIATKKQTLPHLKGSKHEAEHRAGG